MKPKQFLHFFLFLFAMVVYSQTPTFQVTKGVTDLHLHDLNIEPTLDGSNDFIVAGNLFYSDMTAYVPFLMRVDQGGNVVWFNNYIAVEMQGARCFDIVVNGDIIAMTGSADIPSIHKVFIAEFNAIGGTFIQSRFYDIIEPEFNGRGLHIIVTQSEPTPGYAVGGIVSNAYPISPANSNYGLALRVDFALAPLWACLVDNMPPGTVPDFDMVNHITETPTGFFLTGSHTTLNGGGTIHQGILAHKINFLGAFLWDTSYVYGDLPNVSVDAHFDPANQQLFMLCNYENTMYFANTTISDATGVIDYTKSWIATDADNPEKYGFTIKNSVTNPNNLIISGYDSIETWTDNQGVVQNGQSNLFVYEFDMNTGAPITPSYQYLVPHIEPQFDEFNFWNAPMPLIYYPDISLLFGTADNFMQNYFHVGYRTQSTVNFSEIELVKTTNNKLNNCENLIFNPTPSPFDPIESEAISSLQFVEGIPNMFIEEPVAHNIYTCDPNLGIDTIKSEFIRVFPNPTGDYLHIKATNIDSYCITNVLGKEIAKGSLEETQIIDIAHLSKGVYVIALYNNNDRITSKKFIKK